MLLFAAAGEVYLGVANYRDNAGLSTHSAVYRWVPAAPAGPPRSCCDSQAAGGRFVLVQQLPTTAAVSVEYWTAAQNSTAAAYVAAVTEGGTGLALAAATVYAFSAAPPPPAAVVLASSYLGPCDALSLDASSSYGSGGRPLGARWRLLGFNDSRVTATLPAYGLATQALVNSTSLVPSDALQVAPPPFSPPSRRR